MDISLFMQEGSLKELSKEELEKYFRKYNNGDFEARDIIITSNIPLVIFRVLQKFRYINIELNDLISVGIIGLIKSVDNFDLSKGFSFSSFAIRCIDNEILLFIRSEKKHLSNYSIYSLLENDSKLCLIDVLIDDNDYISDIMTQEENLVIRKIINQLPENERDLISLYIGLNSARIKQEELALRYNVKQPTISKKITKVLNKIAFMLNKEDIISLNIENKKVKIKNKNIRLD